MLPLKNTVLFPYLFLPLSAGRPVSMAAVEAVLATEEKTFLAVALKNPEVEQPTADDLYTVGTRAVIKKMARSGAGIELLVQGVERVALVGLEQTEPYLRARVRPLPLPEDQGTEVEALRRAVLELTARALELAHAGRRVQHRPARGPGAGSADAGLSVGSMMSLDVAKEQALLEAPTRLEALRLIHGYLAQELAGARAAAEDHQPGPDRDEQGAAGIHAPPAAPGHPGRAGRDQSRTGRGRRSCATA